MNKHSQPNDCATYENCTFSTDNTEFNIQDQVILKINDIDDLAIAWIVIENNHELLFHNLEEDKDGKLIERKNTQWLWRKGGKHGNGEINISQWILNHEKDYLKDITEFYLVIAIYDFTYPLPWISAGKWSFDATLEKNYKSIWHKHKFESSDTKNGHYGLKYLKVFKINIDKKSLNEHKELKKDKINISEVIPKSTLLKIEKKIKIRYNYVSKIDFENDDYKEYECPPKEPDKKSLSTNILNIFSKILYSIEILTILTLFVAGVLYHKTVISKLHLPCNLMCYFIIFNIVFLLYFFLRYRVGGRAWALVLKKKHNKELDTFMVVLGLLFTAAFDSITSFSFEIQKINGTYYLLSIFSLYTMTNLVLLYILTVISTYIINTLGANKIMVFILIFFIGFAIFTQEALHFELEDNSTSKIENAKGN